MTALGLGLSGQLNLSPRKQRRQPFAPNRLSGLAFWYDADDSSYVGGTWGDLSGQGNDATQPTASKRPTKTTDTAGRTLLRFDGVDDVLSVSTPPSFASGLTFFIVYRVRTAVDFQGIFSASAATGADHQQFFSLEYEQALSRRVQVFGRSAQPNQVFVEGVDSTQAQYAIVTFDDDAINVELRDLNGIRGDISTAVAFGTPAAIVLGARYNAGAPFGFGAVDIYEIGLYARELTGAERDQLENYVAARHGLAWNPMHFGADLAWFHDALDSVFVENGGLVDQWNDQSSQGRHWMQAGDTRPTRTTDGQGRTVVRFDGVDDVMEMSGILPTLEPFSVAVVYTVRNRGDFEGIISAAPTSGTDHAEFWTFQNDSAMSDNMRVFGRSIETDVDAQLLMVRPDTGNAQVSVWTVGTGVGVLRDAGGSISDTYSGSFGTPAEIVLGGRYDGAPFGYAEVDIMATVGVTRALSAADQQRLVAWGTAKWSL
jgi:hypothetical protein